MSFFLKHAVHTLEEQKKAAFASTTCSCSFLLPSEDLKVQVTYPRKYLVRYEPEVPSLDVNIGRPPEILIPQTLDARNIDP